MPQAAAAAGFDSIQYLEHCEGCGCDHELLLTRASGTSACPTHVELRTGPNASRPCECVEAPIGSGSSRMCIACAGGASMLQG